MRKHDKNNLADHKIAESLFYFSHCRQTPNKSDDRARSIRFSIILPRRDNDHSKQKKLNPLTYGGQDQKHNRIFFWFIF